jgi:hypothetical protein
VGTNPSQGIYRGTESRSARSVTLYSLNFNDWLTARSWISLPLSRKQDASGKNHVKISLTWTHAHSCPPLYKEENSNLIWKWGVSDLYPCSTCQVQVQTAFRDFNHQTPQCISNRIQNFSLPFNLNRPMARQPVIFLSAWLPSPRLELWTLASYTIWVGGNKNEVP